MPEISKTRGEACCNRSFQRFCKFRIYSSFSHQLIRLKAEQLQMERTSELSLRLEVPQDLSFMFAFVVASLLLGVVVMRKKNIAQCKPGTKALSNEMECFMLHLIFKCGKRKWGMQKRLFDNKLLSIIAVVSLCLII